MSDATPSTPPVLRTDLVLEYPFTRTTGPIVGAFLTGLREGIICGVKRADGSVLVPPTEYDPQSAEPLTEVVEVGQAGEVVSWTWNAQAREQQPWDRPFAWALIRLDGAATPMLHAVLVDGPEQMATGMRVTARWRSERTGHIADLEGFVPQNGEEGAS
ncbi:MAG: OB-fold domain-containing protein [Acidimicrobiales bacterium]|nr:OB-fold domain-containing protein [Acidimicrobiales bacterium]